jgi:hypothetical protein
MSRSGSQWLTSVAGLGDYIGFCEWVEAAVLRIPTLPRLQLVPMVGTSRFAGLA